MPNGDPEWGTKELPKLEAFFAPLAEDIRQFASTHNLVIERYYHESPSWSLRFGHPLGGNAAINIRMTGAKTFVLDEGWYIHDYDECTRSIRCGGSPEYTIGGVSLTEVLQKALQMLTWKKGEWTQVARGYKDIWHQFTREQFENMGRPWPKPRFP